MRKSLKAVIAGGTAMAAVWMGSGTAFATGPTTADVIQATQYGDCEASINLTGTDQNYAYANFWNHNTDVFNCDFWIERGVRDSSGVYHWTNLYGNNPIYLGYTSGGVNVWTTGQYWDGGGYLAEACFYLIDTQTAWTGATHCTSPV